MEQGQEGCADWLEPRMYRVHAMMVRLLGRCTCQAPTARVHELYTIDGARSTERVSA